MVLEPIVCWHEASNLYYLGLHCNILLLTSIFIIIRFASPIFDRSMLSGRFNTNVWVVQMSRRRRCYVDCYLYLQADLIHMYSFVSSSASENGRKKRRSIRNGRFFMNLERRRRWPGTTAAGRADGFGLQASGRRRRRVRAGGSEETVDHQQEKVNT